MLKQSGRHAVARSIILSTIIMAFIALIALPSQCAYADDIKKPDGLQVLVNGQPYSGFNIAEGYYSPDQEQYGAYYQDATLDGAKVSIGNLPEGWYITSFKMSDDGSRVMLMVADHPLWLGYTVQYSWFFSGRKD